MQQTNEAKYAKRLMYARLRILNDNGFYGLLLMNMKFGLDYDCKTAYTDAEYIRFSPKFMDELSDSELEFVLLHEVLHVVLKHCYRGRNYHQELFNIACDIVVNSNILKSKAMDLSYITLRKYGEAMHTVEYNEGYLYTAEEVYEKLLSSAQKVMASGLFDDHSHWDEANGSNESKSRWDNIVLNAAQIEMQRQKNGKGCGGGLPPCIERLVKELTNSVINWRALLNDFLTFDITDYSFNPPDKRFDEFFLPSFNEPEEKIEEILFMVDTSGSMSEDEITDVYSEINGAMQQYNNKITAKIGFFDTDIYEPVPFSNVNDLKKIIPKGGGGTDFNAVMKYVKSLDEPPKALIIMTDGECSWPDESIIGNIPLLWVINNEYRTPPYGVIARLIKKN